MKCVVPNQCLKTVVRAVWCLSKIGEEIYIEAQADSLSLKTTNCAKTAYICVVLRKEFFLSYDYPVLDDPGHSTKCKLPTRPFLSIFKSLPNLEKLVDHCTIQVDHDDTELVVSFHYRQGFVKSHHLGFQDCDKLQAVFSKEETPVVISGSAKVLQDVAANFPMAWDEVAIIATSKNLSFKSYLEDDRTLSKVGVTEINLSPSEFEEYSVQEDTNVVCSLKTMRALLTFAEANAHEFDLRIDGRGKPVILSLSNRGDYEVDMVLATLVEPEMFEYVNSSQVSVEVCGSRALQGAVDTRSGERGTSVAQQNTEPEESNAIDDDLDLMDFENVSPVPSPPSTVPLLPRNSQSDTQTLIADIPNAGGFSNLPESTASQEGKGLLSDVDFGFTKRQPVKERSARPSQLTDELFGDTEDDFDYSDVIPGTPEAKKYKNSLWDFDIQSTREEPRALVLAPDSDPED